MKKDKSIQVIEKHPGEYPGHMRTIPNTLKAFQEAVGGPIETVTITNDAVIICNEEGRCIGTDEEGRMISLPYNCSICGVEFVGTILMAGVEGDKFATVPITMDEWAKYIQTKFLL